MLKLVAFCVLVLQATIMLVDELYFHRRRRLPHWERIGHPLDTLTVLACYVVALLLPPLPVPQRLFACLGVFSCLFVTKDEFVHAKECGPFEQWLHSLLFVLHPLAIASIGLLWFGGADDVLLVQASLTLAFGIYQVLYWNVPWTKSDPIQ